MTDLYVAQVVDRPAEIAFTADFPGVTAEGLFDYFTTPALLARWWAETASVDPRPGGDYRLAWPARQWELFGRFTVFQRGERLEFTWNWKHLPELPTRQVRVLFEPHGGGVRILLIHGRYAASPAEQQDRQSHIDGWNYFLPRLQAVVIEDHTLPG